MLKIPVLDIEAKRSLVGSRRLFLYRPGYSSEECQHADIAESCFDDVHKQYSTLYFCGVSDDGKRSDGRGSVHAPTQGVAEG
jgi:hypothetical protein